MHTVTYINTRITYYRHIRDGREFIIGRRGVGEIDIQGLKGGGDDIRRGRGKRR